MYIVKRLLNKLLIRTKIFSDNKALNYEQWLKYPDGCKSFFEMRKVPFYSKYGRHLGLVEFRDITERKRHQESLEKVS